MATYKTGAFVRSKYYTPFQKTLLKWIPRSKSGASKSRPRWAAHTLIGNVWEYTPGPNVHQKPLACKTKSFLKAVTLCSDFLFVRALFQKHDSSNLSWKVCKSCVTVPASKRSREQPVIYSRDVLQPSKYLIANSGKLN